MRIDRLLYFLRLAQTRVFAQNWVGEGHMRINGQRVTRLNHPVAVGDVLTLPLRTGVRVVQILALPTRRGPAPEAQACYRVLDAANAIAIAGATKSSRPEEKAQP